MREDWLVVGVSVFGNLLEIKRDNKVRRRSVSSNVRGKIKSFW